MLTDLFIPFNMIEEYIKEAGYTRIFCSGLFLTTNQVHFAPSIFIINEHSAHSHSPLMKNIERSIRILGIYLKIVI